MPGFPYIMLSFQLSSFLICIEACYLQNLNRKEGRGEAKLVKFGRYQLLYLPMKDQHYYHQVFEVTKLIPRGCVSTYGAIADYLALGSARMVGWALNKSSLSEGVPAHRVVNRKGELSGRRFFPSPTMMQELLESEGVIVENDKVKFFDQHFWDPSEQLSE